MRSGSHNKGIDLKAMMAGLEGLDLAVLSVLRYSIGRENAMPRKRLVQHLRNNPIYKNIDERHVRQTIHELRQSGRALICSTGGINGGYWIAAGWDEVEEFIQKEVEPRALGLLETKKAMLQAAGKHFGPKPELKQERLF